MCNCPITNSVSFTDIASLVVAIIACILAWLIPEKIKWEQLYSSLITEYRSFSFGLAVQGVVDFFHDKCECDVSRIPKKYKERFHSDFEKLNKRNGEIPYEQVLHFQRRMLSQYFYQLDLCARHWIIGKRRIQRDFTKSEANITKVLYYMNVAVEENDELFKDISCYDRVPQSEHVKGLKNYISHIHHILKETPRYLR